LIVTRKRGDGRYYFALWQTNNNTPNKLLLSESAVSCLLRVRSVCFTSRAVPSYFPKYFHIIKKAIFKYWTSLDFNPHLGIFFFIDLWWLSVKMYWKQSNKKLMMKSVNHKQPFSGLAMQTSYILILQNHLNFNWIWTCSFD
jgi:hypothetical protein